MILAELTDLALCLAALALGPVVYQLSTAKRSTYAFFDGFVLVGVGGLVLFEILPGTFSNLGLVAVPIAIFGFIFPHFLEHRLNSLPVSPRTILSSLIILGLVIHQLLDGAALNNADRAAGEHAVTTLGLAVILHQVPKGFLLWEISRKASGVLAAILVVAGLLAATTAGYLLGSQVLGLVESRWVLCFQAFVAGGLLHVVVHHVTGGAEGRPHSMLAFWSGAGALVACGILAWMPHVHFIDAPSDQAFRFRGAFFELAMESSPPILAGFLAAGLLQAFVSLKSLRWFHGRNRVSSALRGIVFGIPLPICSCGVTPIYHALIRRGVPAAAAVSFLIATPEIGLDSFFLSLGLLGTKITIIRLGMAFGVAFLTSCLLGRLYSHVFPAAGGEPVEPIEDPGDGAGLFARLKRAVQFGWIDLVEHLGAWILAGLVIAALTEPYVRPEWFSQLPPGLDVILLALAGLPIYVCASGATPLAAVLLSKGVSVGAVLAFLITGPTTNVTTFGVLSRLHGRWRAAALPGTVFLLSIVAGFAINAIVKGLGGAIVPKLGEHPHGTVEIASALTLAALVGISILRTGPRRFLGKLGWEQGLGHSHFSSEEAEQDGVHGHEHEHEHEHGDDPAQARGRQKGCGCGET